MTNRSTKNKLTEAEITHAIILQRAGCTWPQIDKHFGFPKKWNGMVSWPQVGQALFPNLKDSPFK